MYTCTIIYYNTCVHSCMHTKIYNVYVCIQICTYIMYILFCVCVYTQCAFVQLYIRMYICLCVCTYTCVCTLPIIHVQTQKGRARHQNWLPSTWHGLAEDFLCSTQTLFQVLVHFNQAAALPRASWCLLARCSRRRGKASAAAGTVLRREIKALPASQGATAS